MSFQWTNQEMRELAQAHDELDAILRRWDVPRLPKTALSRNTTHLLAQVRELCEKYRNTTEYKAESAAMFRGGV